MLQVLADERCLHLMPPMDLSISGETAYAKPQLGSADGGDQPPRSARQQLRHMLRELRQTGAVDKCHKTSSLVKDL